MNVVIIGTGNVAAVLGRKIKAAGHRIVQVYGRNAKAASELAYEWDTESTNYKSTISQGADLYLVAVTDKAIPELLQDLRLPGRVIAHTAASVPMDILKNVSEHIGVLYPLQSLRNNMQGLPDVPLYVEAGDEKARSVLMSIANSISPEKVTAAGGEERVKLHVAAVFVNNFTNHMYRLAADFCRKEGLDFSQLQPLIEETALRLREMPPEMALTGPAVRKDEETIARHLAVLEKHPRLKEIYQYMTRSIQGEI